jgi:hypothetical protein
MEIRKITVFEKTLSFPISMRSPHKFKIRFHREQETAIWETTLACDL